MPKKAPAPQKAKLQTMIDAELFRQLKHLAVDLDINLSTLVEGMIEHFFKTDKTAKKLAKKY